MKTTPKNNKLLRAKSKFSNLTLLLSFFISSVLCSQSENYSFYIADQMTKEPIYQCYVLIKGKNISSLSTENGLVKIKAHPKDTLVIYQTGYSLKTIAIKDVEKLDKQIFLSRKNITLDEVVIADERVKTIREKDNTVFIDFEFYDDYLLCLVNKGKKFNSLMLIDVNGTTLFETTLNRKVDELFKDCLENIHLLADDSIYQVYYDYKRLHLLPPYPIRIYHNYLQHCECSSGEKYIFKEIRYQKLKNTYSYYNLKDSSEKILSCVADSLNIRDFKLDFDLRYFLGLRRTGQAYLYSVTEINKNIEKFREELVLDPHYARMLKPMESEVKKIDTNFVLFDYTHYEASYFSLEGNLNRKLPLDGFSKIYPKLYIDHDMQNYLFSERNRNNGLLTLYRFDKLQNKFSHSYVLKNYYYIKNYKIKGNYLYFINKIRTQYDVKTKIIKIYIDWEKI